MKVISGMIAADGAAWRMTNTGMPKNSAFGERPIATPAATPPIATRLIPTRRGPIVSEYARANVPSASISPNAAIVAVKLGKVTLIGIRPPSSQSARTAAMEAARSRVTRMAGVSPLHSPCRPAAPAAGAARPLPVTGPYS